MMKNVNNFVPINAHVNKISTLANVISAMR